jgi:hypothetical protein
MRRCYAVNINPKHEEEIMPKTYQTIIADRARELYGEDKTAFAWTPEWDEVPESVKLYYTHKASMEFSVPLIAAASASIS